MTDARVPNVALIGAGYWGRNIARALARLGALAHVVDGAPAVAAAVAAEHGAKAASLDEALADPRVEGVAIAAPAELHADIAARALRAGKGVFVEKPLALSLQDGRMLVDLARETGRTLMVGHLLRYHPAFEALLAAVRADRLGRLRYAYSNRLSLGKFRVEEDVLWSFAPHDISMLLALFDAEPSSVAAVSPAFVTPGVGDEVRLDLRFPGGAHAHVFASWLHPFKEHRLVVVGEAAMAVFEDSAPADRKLLLYPHGMDLAGAAPAPVKQDAVALPYDSAEPLLRECAHFLDRLADGATPRTDGEEALRVLRVLTAASAAIQGSS